MISACDHTQTVELSQFIAACIVCGSYNTTQSRQMNPAVQEKYALNLAYMNLASPAKELELKKQLWKAAQSSYIAFHREGGRFYSLNIIERRCPRDIFQKTAFCLAALQRTELSHH